MSSYYHLSGKDTSRGTIALAPEATKLSHHLIADLDSKNECPFEFKLHSVHVNEKGLDIGQDFSGIVNLWEDLLTNGNAWLMMSDRLRSVIDTQSTNEEDFDWIKCNVHFDTEEKTYYVLRFNSPLDVLDKEKTTFVKGTDQIIRPVFAASKVQHYSIFPRPTAYDFWRMPSSVYVNNKIKTLIQKSDLSGIEFSRVPIV